MTGMPEAAALASAFDSGGAVDGGDHEGVHALGDHVLDLVELGRDVVLGVLQHGVVARGLELLDHGVAVRDPARRRLGRHGDADGALAVLRPGGREGAGRKRGKRNRGQGRATGRHGLSSLGAARVPRGRIETPKATRCRAPEAGATMARVAGGVKAQYHARHISRLVWMTSERSVSLLRRGLKIGHLRLMATLAETKGLGVAAARLGLTQPAASRLLAEAEELAGRPLHRREGRGIALTPAGEALARRAARALSEVAAAEREMDDLGRGVSGDVRLGAVTGPALDRVLPAVRAARLSLPGLTCEVEVAPSEPLAELLLAGRLDFALARLPEGRDPALFDWRPLGEEPVRLAVRPGHALARRPRLEPSDLLAYDWVMPGPGTLMRRTVEARLAALGLPAPPGRLATSSFLLTLAMLRETNAIAPLAEAVARRFASGPEAGLVILPIDLGLVVPAFGLATLRSARLTPAAERLRDLVLAQQP
jgi:DNA-binding transcriptional LysR family regulator